MLPALIGLAAWAQASPARPSAEDHLATAELFARRGWFEDAWQEVQAGLARPDGATNLGLHELAMELAWERLDPLASAAWARKAAAICPDEDRADRLRERAEALDRGFGELRVEASQPGLRGRLQLEALGPLLDPEHRRYVQRIATQLRETQELPRRVALPTGAYLLNGREVRVEAGRETALLLPVRALGLRGMSALQVVRLELGTELGQIHGGPLAPRPPRPGMSLGLSLPAGPLFASAELGLHLDGQTSSASSLVPGLGLRLGKEWVLEGPLSLRPALSYRGWREAALRLTCTGPSSPSWACGPPREDAGAGIELPLWMHGLGAELALEWSASGQTRATGLAVLLGEELGLRRLPAAGETRLEGEDLRVKWTTGREWLSAPSLRLGVRLSLVQ